VESRLLKVFLEVVGGSSLGGGMAPNKSAFDCLFHQEHGGRWRKEEAGIHITSS